jgi:hypothetical protein
MARAVVNRMLHEPTMRIKASAERGGSYVQLQALRELFGLEGDAPDYELGESADVTSLEARRRKQS